MALAILSRVALRGDQVRGRDSSSVETAAKSARREGGLEPLGAKRFAFVDALRGIAALSVAAYHIDRYGPLPGAASAVVPIRQGS